MIGIYNARLFLRLSHTREHVSGWLSLAAQAEVPDISGLQSYYHLSIYFAITKTLLTSFAYCLTLPFFLDLFLFNLLIFILASFKENIKINLWSNKPYLDHVFNSYIFLN